MGGDILSQILILLAGSVVVLSLVRRFALPPILGYLVVGMLLGPHALGLASDAGAVHLLAEIGVVFLVFTLGLEFSLARMIAMKAEVLGVGGLQMVLTTAVIGGTAWALGVDPAVAIVIGGALAMSSTAIVVRQLGEQLEINRTHSRLAVGILLFQDLAFAPFLALATSLGTAQDVLSPTWLLGMVGRATLALLLVLFVGRRLLRPLFGEIARHRSSETFTLTVLFVALGSAWATNALGLSMALGGFLAGMLLAETEFRHQTEAVIKPFQDILLGLFFVSVGMLLDLRLLLAQLPLVLLLLGALLVTKALIILLIARQFVPNTRKALRTGIVVCMGGEFGFALLTLLLKGRVVDPGIVQALLTTIALSMVLGPLIVRYNSRIADLILRRPTAEPSEIALETAATRELARREHVIICGFGRVGQNLARVLEKHGFEYIALDLDPFRIRDARQAGDPVVYGDASEPEVLRALGDRSRQRRRRLVRRPGNGAQGRAGRAPAARRRAGAGAHRGRLEARCTAGGRRDRGDPGDLRDQPLAGLARAAVPQRAGARDPRDHRGHPARPVCDPAQRLPPARSAAARGRPLDAPAAADGRAAARRHVGRARHRRTRPRPPERRRHRTAPRGHRRP